MLGFFPKDMQRFFDLHNNLRPDRLFQNSVHRMFHRWMYKWNTLIPNLHCKCHHCILNNSIISVSITIVINFPLHIDTVIRRQKTLPKHVCKETESCRLCVEYINKSATQWYVFITLHEEKVDCIYMLSKAQYNKHKIKSFFYCSF